jgi:hypothetical protein
LLIVVRLGIPASPEMPEPSRKMACGVRKVGLCGEAVFVEESAESVAAPNEARGSVPDLQLLGQGIGWLVERAVWPVAVVVAGEDAEHTLEVTPVHDREPVQTLRAGGADEALGDRVRLRRPHRRLDDLDAFACKHGVEITGELAVAVADQEPKRAWLFLERPGELARLLGDPGAGRIRAAGP